MFQKSVFNFRTLQKYAPLLFAILMCCFTPDMNAQQRNVEPVHLNDLCMPFRNTEFLQIKPDVVISSREFLAQCNSLLALPEASKMKFISTRTDQFGITHTKYQQFVDGIAVMGGEMILNEKDGRLIYVNGMYMLSNKTIHKPAISAEQAFQKSLSFIKTTDYSWLDKGDIKNETDQHAHSANAPVGELLWVSNMAATPEERTYTLGWKHSISVSTPFESYDVYLNALNGELLLKVPMQFNCTQGTCQTLWNGQKNISTKLSSGTYIMHNDCDPANIIIKNANLNYSTITNYTDVDNIWPNTTLGKYIGETMYAMEQTKNYYNTIHNQSGYDSAGYDYTVYLNPGFNNNAYYDFGSKAIAFGGNTNGDSAVVSLDIAGHESTHGMVQFSSNLVYSYQPGALNESFADIFGEMVERHARGSNDWLLGADIYMGAFRSMSNPNQYYQPDTYYGTYWSTSSFDDGGVHTNSGVQNYWFYLLVNGGTGTNDDGYNYTVSGIGYTKAREIAYQTMKGLTSSAGYVNAKDLSIAITTSIYGQCSNEVMQVRKAWAAVGVGDPFTPYITNNNVTVTSPATSICLGTSVTLTAGGAVQYSWLPAPATGAVYTATPTNAVTTYTVTGTNALGSCGGTSVITITTIPKPVITTSTNDNSLCIGQSANLYSSSASTLDTLFTTTDGWYAAEAQVFDVHANQSITIHDLRVNMSGPNPQVKVWYKFGGIGNTAVTSSTGWIPWGGPIAVSSAGQGNLSFVNLPFPLNISTGQTLGILIATTGDLHYTNGNGVNPVIYQDASMQIMQGFQGTGYNGTFNLSYNLALFNGEIIYSQQISNYAWAPSTGLSASNIQNPVCTPASTTTYTVTATNGLGCTNTSSTTIYVNSLPVIQSIVSASQPICHGSSSQLTATCASLENDIFITSSTGNLAHAGSAFNITATKNITINNFGILTNNSTQAEVWYKPGGYGGVDFTGSGGWTKLGNTILFSPVGPGLFSTLVPSSTLNIPAGLTYGIVIVTNGTSQQKNGTAVGNLISSNQDMAIYEGHAGSGFGGSFNFNSSPKIWCGKISYTVNNEITNYLWSNAQSLSSTTIANPIASPVANTTYTLTVTDGNNCTASSSFKAFVRQSPQVIVAASPAAVCSGATAQMLSNNGAIDADAIQTPANGSLSTLTNGGVVFNAITSRAITIQGFKLHIQTGATQAEIWYKTSSYGNSNLSSSAGWTKLGNTVSISPAGVGNLTTIPISTTLFIPAGSTYGIAIVCNGIVRYSAGSAVGATIQTTPELSITQGHAGTGFNGVFNFNTAPAQFNGEVSYSVQHGISTYAWSPSQGINNTSSASPLVTPINSTVYSLTATDLNGCSGSGSVGVQVMNPAVGVATVTPANACVGTNGTLNYTAPIGNQCHGVLQTGFSGSYAPATWTTVSGGLGSISTSSAPSSINITSGNTGVNGNNTTAWQHTVLCSGYVTFNWSYTTGDAGPHLDYPRYKINGGTPQLFPTFENGSTDAHYQNGTFSMFLNAGDVLQIQAYTANNMNGACTITIVGFSAPYATSSAQTVQWYSQAIGGSLLGSGSSLSIPFNTPGTNTYYAAVTNTANGCSTINRVATNTVNITSPVISITGNNSVCSGSSIGLTATGAATYAWQPGGLTGNTVSLNPIGNTTYTVTGTSAQGCTATATKTIIVNSTPNVNVSASSNSVSCGSGTTLTASGASTYYWMPNFTTGSNLTVTPSSTTTYTITGTSSNGCTASATKTITVVPCPTGNLLMLVYIEGYYSGYGEMRPALFNQGATTIPTLTDSLIVEFHDTTPAHNLVYSSNTTIKTNGVVECTYPASLIGGNYYIAIRHRNSIETWTAAPVTIYNTTYYDFSYAASQAYGSNQVEVASGVWALYSGDLNDDENIDLLDASILETDINSFKFGYYATDINGDGNVDLLDSPIVETNINNFIFSSHP